MGFTRCCRLELFFEKWSAVRTSYEKEIGHSTLKQGVGKISRQREVSSRDGLEPSTMRLTASLCIQLSHQGPVLGP